MSKVILFGYPESPYAGKIVCALTLFEIPYKLVRVGRVLPRPELTRFGITYRRIPVLAIGKDLFCDTKAIITALIKHFPDKVKGKLGDAAMNTPLEMFGTAIFRQAILMIYPKPPDTFIKDRKDVFPIIASPKFDRLRPHAVGEICSLFDDIERDLLNGKQFIHGDDLTLNDVHVAFMAGWATQFLKSTSIGYQDYPAVYDYIARFNKALDWPKAFGKAPQITSDEAFSMITSAEHVMSPSVSSKDMLGYKAGDEVQVYPTDAPPNPQHGKLVGLNASSVVLELPSGIYVVFPRLGIRILQKTEEKL